MTIRLSGATCVKIRHEIDTLLPKMGFQAVFLPPHGHSWGDHDRAIEDFIEVVPMLDEGVIARLREGR